MRTIITFSIVLYALLVDLSLCAGLHSIVADDSIPEARTQFLAIDIVGFPFDHTHSGSWQPSKSLRIGYGRNLVYTLGFRVFAEYCEFDFDNHDGNFYQDYSYGKRYDYAIYPAIVAFDIVEFALGGYYTTQDEIIHRSFFSPQPTFDPVVKKVKVFIHLGLGKSFHIVGPISFSLGMVWRNFTQEGGTYFGCRAGMRVEI